MGPFPVNRKSGKVRHARVPRPPPDRRTQLQVKKPRPILPNERFKKPWRDKKRPAGFSGARHGSPTHAKPARREHNTAGITEEDGPLRLFGLHAVEAALKNPARRVKRLLLTENAERRLIEAIGPIKPEIERVTPRDLDRLLGPDTVHQGAMLETEPLPEPEWSDLADTASGRPLIVLDQVTDPHNVSRALDELKSAGFTIVGLDGDAEQRIEDIDWSRPTALVMGSEGKGLRELTRKTCDSLARITTDGPVASLNVSNAAAVALHTAMLARQK